MKAYLSLGSNEGDRKDYLLQALEMLADSCGITITKKSQLYETAPWGNEDQAAFLNMAAEIETDLDPLELLDRCQYIENTLGRKRSIHWGPRTMDIDILDCQDIRLSTERLTIPHPYMEQREFVLAPLREIVPDYILPSGNTITAVKGEGTVKRLNEYINT
ncbi:2-amino-4-hydroxy-6-hydroxymethyldihydropteridine diphosphokinase [Dehalobacter sp. DCM]|uniref:2-amino-4-hydroxy-6- hydroxymethyldihydropteridine diphosphokinase n=1 Tax=Dehalobacter sp. DCM TaxID=2907827 RepID=UPI003081AEA6|nr:2-amino-4-hydroxy-6-hydroxymethyldihydropteridine diphosphokinase [Dehalobacter sp. DCM]